LFDGSTIEESTMSTFFTISGPTSPPSGGPPFNPSSNPGLLTCLGAWVHLTGGTGANTFQLYGYVSAVSWTAGGPPAGWIGPTATGWFACGDPFTIGDSGEQTFWDQPGGAIPVDPGGVQSEATSASRLLPGQLPLIVPETVGTITWSGDLFLALTSGSGGTFSVVPE
jgi:hypothetical protein